MRRHRVVQRGQPPSRSPICLHLSWRFSLPPFNLANGRHDQLHSHKVSLQQLAHFIFRVCELAELLVRHHHEQLIHFAQTDVGWATLADGCVYNRYLTCLLSMR